MTIKQVSEKNKKDEIFEAYQEAIKKIENMKKDNSPINNEAKEEEKVLLQKTKCYSKKEVNKDIHDFKKNSIDKLNSLNNSLFEELDIAMNKLNSELERLEEVRKSISIEENRLKELYGLKNSCISLSDFLEFIEEEKQKWEEEKKDQEKKRQREDEEYIYQLYQKRKKGEDEYVLKQKQIKEMFDEDIKHRREEIDKQEAELKNQLEELNELRQYKKEYEKRLEENIKKSLESQKNELQKDFINKTNLENQKHQSEKDLLEQRVKHYQETIKQLETQMNLLKKEENEANKRAQELAITIVQSQKKNNFESKEKDQNKD